MMQTDPDYCVRVLAPVGRDAELACEALRGHEIFAIRYPDVSTLCAAMAEGTGAILLTQEALALPGFGDVVSFVDAQPPWSDLPMIVLVSPQIANSDLGHVLTTLDERTYAHVLERPLRIHTIVHAAESALRARRRQYELREHLDARSRAEAAERVARAAAEEALRAREEFLSIASHELRNPVAAIHGTTQLLARARSNRRLTEARLDAYIESLDAAGKHLALLTDDLLDVSRLQRGALPLRLQPADLVHLVRDLIRRGDFPEHPITLEFTEHPLIALVDPDRITQVVSNLLDNATKYSAPGGRVFVRLRADPDRGGVLLEVQDEGIGLDPSVLDAIFEPFVRTPSAIDANISGLGLGLYLSRRIAEQHQGRLWASSSGEGKGGTVMSLWLPRSLAVEPSDPTTEGVAAPAS